MLMDWNPKTPPPPSLWDWDPQPDWPLTAAPPPLPQEPPLGLRLGKRTYFEDATPSAASTAAAAAKRTRASSVQMFRCQVEGCGADLAASKDYHRKHRVCELHSKSPRVVVAGQERRFCQQCSRFHDLAAFDEKKKSCRKRLSDHNARRRKPQPGTISFGSAASAFYDNRQQMNLLVNRASLGPVRQTPSSAWEGSFDFKLSDIKGSWIKSPKGDGEGHMLLSGSELTNAFSTLRNNLGTIFPFKGTPTEVLNQGSGASTVASSLNRAPDLRCAFSLLSTDSWVTTEHEPTASSAHPALTNQTSATQHATHTMNSASDRWQDEQPLTQPSRMTPFSIPSNASQFQEFQVLKSSYETTFFDSTGIQ